MLQRLVKALAITALLGYLVSWPVWLVHAKNGTTPFCVHATSTQSYFNQNGTTNLVSREVVWGKAPDKYFVETESYIKISNERESWIYNKNTHICRALTPHSPAPYSYTADYRISTARKAFADVQVKETREGARSVVEVFYKSREAKPCKVYERMALLDGKSRLITALTVVIYSQDGTYVSRRLESTMDYSPITDESVFYKHTPPADAIWERSAGK